VICSSDNSYLYDDRSSTSSRHSRSSSSLSAVESTRCCEYPPPQPSKSFVFKLPNFMYSLSHSYTGTCYKDISDVIKKVYLCCFFPAVHCIKINNMQIHVIAFSLCQSKSVAILGTSSYFTNDCIWLARRDFLLVFHNVLRQKWNCWGNCKPLKSAEP